MRPASEAERVRLGDLFADLCRIPSPSGQERACADRVTAELRGMGLAVEEDDAARELGGEAGNLLVRMPSRGPRTVLLCAHLDTVAPVAPIEPVIVDDGWENAHPGILGADNKAAVAVLLEVARRASVEGSPVGLELLFTVSEEVGLRGAKAFDAGRLDASLGYVFDHATPIGEVVVASPSYYRLEAELHGRAAHAGIRPEAGRSAVLAAARAVAAMPLGRIDAETTTNVASISGGGPGTNVVPDRCRLVGEARSLDAARADEVVARMVDALQDAANTTECDLDVVTQREFAGYRLRSSEPAVLAAEAALRATGYEPRRIATGGAADANALHAAGLPCVNLANGTERNHEPTERVSVPALEGMLDVTLALLDEVAALP